MANKIVRLLGALLLASFVTSSALGADYVVDASERLKDNNVYIAPGIGNSETFARLSRSLRNGDSTVLAMLPAIPEESIDSIVSRLSTALGDNKIIGLSVGQGVIGYAPKLPSGVASDLMRRANSVSNDPVTALITFAQNVHIWQADHPEPGPIEVATSGSTPIVIGIVAVAAIFIISGLLAWLFIGRDVVTGEADKIRTRFTVPGELKEMITGLAKKSQLIHDHELRHAVYQICTDIEVYFQGKRANRTHDAVSFRDRLDEVTIILDKYLRVQNDREYHNNPDAVMTLGKESIIDFADYVVKSIRLGNDEDLREFKVSARTLEAYREVRFPGDSEEYR